MATYGCTVEIALSGNRIVGNRGFSDYLEKIEDGGYGLKLDASLGVNEFAVSVRPHNSAIPGVWSAICLKVVDPPGYPTGTYLATSIMRDGTGVDQDFDVIVNTFR